MVVARFRMVVAKFSSRLAPRARGAILLRFDSRQKRAEIFAEWGFFEPLSQNSSTPTSVRHFTPCNENLPAC
jgi:hypothetical protein